MADWPGVFLGKVYILKINPISVSNIPLAGGGAWYKQLYLTPVILYYPYIFIGNGRDIPFFFRILPI